MDKIRLFEKYGNVLGSEDLGYLRDAKMVIISDIEQ
jgi:hypothetical protein